MSSAYVSAFGKESASNTLQFATFDFTVAAGDLIYLVIATPSTTDQITSVVTGGNAATGAWSKQKVQLGTNATCGTIEIWSTAIMSVANGASLALTINSSGSGISAIGTRFTGSSENVDASSGNSPTSPSTTHLVSSNSFTTTNANDVWLAGFCTNAGPGTFSASNLASPNNAWNLTTSLAGATSGMPMTVDYKIVTATVSGATMGGSDTSNSIAQYSGVIVAFKEALPVNPAAILNLMI